jgi:TonB-linked SusC/RagA family outer membrane protein
MAQGLTLSGTVTDKSTGEPLPAVNIFVPQLNRGAVTDVDGKYSVVLPAGSYELRVTSVGFKRLNTNVTVQGASLTFNIQLEPDVIGLDQVLVVGYGEISRRNVTGAITSVGGSDIQYNPVNTVESAIQGRVSGVFIQQNNGKLGQGMQVRVRGSSSVSASNQPLYVIDGVPVIMDDFSISAASTNPLAQFNFNDVESIQILKDASAAAIYGSRAANGVVLITTKSGRPGRTQFSYSFQRGSSEPTSLVEMMNAKQYVNYMYKAAMNSDRLYYEVGAVDGYTAFLEGEFDTYGLGTDWRQCLDPSFISILTGNPGGGGACPVDTDWQAEAFQDASMFSHDLSASGGNEATRFFVSGHFSDQDGILIKDRFQRANIRLNLDHKATDRIRLGMNITAGRSFHQRLSTDNAFTTPLQLIAQMPISPLYYPDEERLPANYNNETYYYNGVIHKDFSKYHVTTMRSTGTSYLAYNILPSLELRSEVSADVMTGYDDQWYGPETAVGFPTAGQGGYASVAWQQSVSYGTAHYLNHSLNLGRNQTLATTAGFSYQYNDNNYAFTARSNFPNNNFQRLTSAANLLSGTTTGSEYSFLSYFARSNYALNDRYLLSLSGRVDGSSRFGADNRYGFFPAASVGWILSEESFATPILPIVSFLKLRLSHGTTGNAGIGNFSSLGLWSAIPYGAQSGMTESQLKETSLTWETTTQTDIGFDYGFLNNRITGEFDYYEKNTRDLLLNVQIPGTSGFTTTTRNVGKMQNKGWEIVVNTFNLTGEFKWNTSFNLSANRNKVTDLDGQVLIGGLGLNRGIKGQPIGVFYGKKYAGVDPETGDAWFFIYDKEGTGGSIIDTTTNFNLATDRVLGNPNPDFIGGLGNNFSYKGFSLDILFQFVQGIDANISGHGRWSRGNGIFEDNSVTDQLNSWTPENRNTKVPEARYGEANGNQASSRYIVDASYVRLKNVTLSYTVPRQLLRNSGLTRVRLYGTGVNLLTFTDYPGWDPEMNTDFAAGNIGLGNDFYTAPQAKTITFGIDIGF